MTWLVCWKQSLLLVDVFENFRNMCLETYKLDPIKFLSAPGFAWESAWKTKQSQIKVGKIRLK